jgi:predicted O-methyltransferase YrrM
MVNEVKQCSMPAVRLAHLERIARKHSHALGSGLATVISRELVMLEVGSLTGTSAKVLAQFGKVWCVDTWPNGMKEFLANTIGLPIMAFHARSEERLPQFASGMFDLINIDGDHTYPVVLSDMQQARRLIKPGGIICGDDLERQIESGQELSEVMDNCHIDFIGGYHPGVTLAVYTVFGRVQEQDGFWWLQC